MLINRYSWIVMGFLVAALTGCTEMTESILLDTRLSRQGTVCEGNLGAYSLPRREIKVTIKDAVDNGDRPGYSIDVVPGSYVPDANHVYCLDFLSARVADERIGVKRNGLLLERVYTKSTDKTLTEATKLVQAGADLISAKDARSRGRASQVKGGIAGADVLRLFEFDPLIETDTRKVNAALRPYGYCIYLKRRGDDFAPDWSEAMCDPSGELGGWLPYKSSVSYETGNEYEDTKHKFHNGRPVPEEIRQRGIFYRPELTHVLVVMRQDHPGVIGAPWHRAGSMRLKLPNASPPFLLNVKRSVFVEAKSDIKFNQGLIQSISIDKKSELLAVSEFVIDVVQIVQKIPSKALSILSNDVDNKLALIEANEDLITSLEAYNRARGVKQPPRDQVSTDATNIILGRQGVYGRSANEPDAMTTCLNNPEISNSPNPTATCRRLLEKNL